MKDFIKLVKELRELQKDYFKIRSHSLLKQCKEKERELDKRLLDLQYSNNLEQNKLL